MAEEFPTTNNDLPCPDGSTKSSKAVVSRGHSISQSATSTDALNNALEDGTFRNKVSSTWQAASMGGSVFDGFLLAASQEVGQSILTLANVFSQTGFIGGIVLELIFATLALYKFPTGVHACPTSTQPQRKWR